MNARIAAIFLLLVNCAAAYKPATGQEWDHARTDCLDGSNQACFWVA